MGIWRNEGSLFQALQHTVCFCKLAENVTEGQTLGLIVEKKLQKAARGATQVCNQSFQLYRDRQNAETYATAKPPADVRDLPNQLQPSFKGQQAKDTRVCKTLARLGSETNTATVILLLCSALLPAVKQCISQGGYFTPDRYLTEDPECPVQDPPCIHGKPCCPTCCHYIFITKQCEFPPFPLCSGSFVSSNNPACPQTCCFGSAVLLAPCSLLQTLRRTVCLDSTL